MPPTVDIHSHLMAEDWLPARWWDAKADIRAHHHERRGRAYDWQTLRAEAVTESTDPDGARLLERMDAAGIDHQVVFPVDFGVPLDDPPTDIRGYNDRIRDFQADHPERVTAFVSIDPRRDGAAPYVEGALGEWAAGVKLHPATGFDPTGSETYEVLRVAAAADAPVLFHTGRFFAPLFSEPAHPIHLDAVVSDFSDLDVVAAHMGHGWWETLLELARANAHTGLRVGLSGWQPRFADDPDAAARTVRQFTDVLGPDRVHFATDYPAYYADYPPAEWVQTVRSLADDGGAATFTEREVESIMGGGAVDLLGLA